MVHMPFEPTVAGTQVPPPYACTGLRVFGFPLVADIGPLQTLCDYFLSIAPASAGMTFEPIPAAGLFGLNTCVVMMHALDYTSLHATTAPWDGFGGAPQKEVYFAVPVQRRLYGQPVEVGVFLPYVFVDNLTSALTGREVLGLPKLLASFSLERDFPATPIVMRFEGRRTKGGPIAEDELVKVVAPSGALPPKSSGIRISMFFGALDVLFAGSPVFSMINEGFLSNSFYGFSSRMLIDPASPTTDSYQSIVRGTYTMTNVKGSGYLPPVSVTISPFLGIDIQSTLGIRSVAGQVLPVNPFFVNCDLSLGNARVLWES